MNRLPLGTAAATLLGLLSAVASGCLDRDVISHDPSTNTLVSHTLASKQIDKIDLLFVIDNSASMGDKQQYLALAVPELIRRLVAPNCVDATTGQNFGPSDSAGNGTCAQGRVEFPPAHDMHIGVLSTSLGNRLGEQYSGGQGGNCPTGMLTVNGATFTNGADDRAELLSRSGPAATPLADTGASSYLNWFPPNTANSGKLPSAGAPPISSSDQLVTDFAALIQGVGNYGCGIESQLESWYRFLVQPDPYDTLSVDSNGNAQWTGVDTTILKQRHDFLRPDSLVAIIDMTDENDSEVDVRSYGGKGWWFMASTFEPWHATSGCDEGPTGSGLMDASACTSCDLSPMDPSCPMGSNTVYTADNDWGFDSNLRHVHMEQKYGLVPQFPIQRYVLGLTSTTVPDRNGEYPDITNPYQGLTNHDCVNPLFAAALPDGSSVDPATLCKLPAGGRTPDLIDYAHIGGVPHQLLQQDPTNPDSTQKETLTDADWVKILGNDPLHYDYTGIDPHMIESYMPRPGMPVGPGGATDPASGYDWITDQGNHVLPVDRQYACIFPLTTPRDCTNRSDPTVSYACDCPSDASLSPDQIPPLCEPDSPTTQVAAKAYPTQRELLLAKLVGQQGFVSSLCPIHVQPAAGMTQSTDPLFGYNPAVNGIVDRLKTALDNQCSTQKLVADPSGKVSCLALVALPEGTGGAGTSCNHPGAACDATVGLLQPSSDPTALFQQSLLDKFCADHTQPGSDPQITSSQPVCALQQVVVDPSNTKDCSMSAKPGWCYVQGDAATALGCSQPNTIEFTHDEPPSGTVVSLQCLESAVSVTGDGGP